MFSKILALIIRGIKRTNLVEIVKKDEEIDLLSEGTYVPRSLSTRLYVARMIGMVRAAIPESD